MEIQPVTAESIRLAKAQRDRERAEIERVTGWTISEDGSIQKERYVTPKARLWLAKI